MHRALPTLTALALLLALAPPLAAFAGDGDQPIASPAPSIRPPSGVLRHVDAPRIAVSPAAAPSARGREVVVLVGGYQSCVCDRTFEALERRLRAAGFDVLRFGSDPAYPYDTYGGVVPNAISLRDQVRSISAAYSGVHIVTHSMGGVVADTAFASGLSRSDGVSSYVSWSAPHSRSDLAAMAGLTRTAFGDDGGLFRDVALVAGFETDSDAIRDLARARRPKPPPGVARLDLREASDLLVSVLDARAPGIRTRTLVGSLEGHGGILDNDEALDLTVRTISTGRVPPESRPPKVWMAAEVVSTGLGLAESGLLWWLLPGVLIVGGALRTPAGAVLTRMVRRRIGAKRRSC